MPALQNAKICGLSHQNKNNSFGRIREVSCWPLDGSPALRYTQRTYRTGKLMMIRFGFAAWYYYFSSRSPEAVGGA
jgi:hypothetical protein